MNVLGWLGRGLLITLATLGLSVWIIVMTLQSTLLNRTTVLGWLSNSGAYGHIVDSVIGLQNLGQASQAIDQTALKQAVNNTLTPDYIKQVSETTINATFDWLEGKSQNLAFNIPIADKRAELQEQLANIATTKLEDLPACKSGFTGLGSEADCLPPGISPEQIANSAAKQTVEGSDFLAEPLTERSLDQSYVESLDWLPTAFQTLSILAIALPIFALICGLGYVLLSPSRLAGLRKLAEHIVFSAGFTALVGAAMWFFGDKIQLEQVGDSVALLGRVVQPIIHQAIPSIGFWLLVFAGGTTAVSAATWITLAIIGRRAPKELTRTPVSQPAPEHPATNTDRHVLPTVSTAEPTQPNTPEESKPPSQTIGRM